MSTSTLGVGIIGANPETSWASRAHVPAIAALPELRLTAVATSKEETATAAAERFGVDRWFTDPSALAACPEVDVVVVSVKVPAHDTLVRAVLAAGKHVYCEWPLGVDLAEAKELARLAHEAGVRHAVGLQARSSPGVHALRSAVSSGRLGTLLSCSVSATWAFGAAPVRPAAAYLFERAHGANFFTIHCGHLLDGVCYAVGEPHSVVASFGKVYREVELADGRIVPADTPDVVAVAGELAGGAQVAAHLASRAVGPERTRIELIASAGTVVAETNGPGGIHIASLTVGLIPRGEDEMTPLSGPAQVEEVAGALPPGPARNVGSALVRFARDIREGTTTAPTFHDAVRRHAMLASVQTAALTGTRRDVASS